MDPVTAGFRDLVQCRWSLFVGNMLRSFSSRLKPPRAHDTSGAGQVMFRFDSVYGLTLSERPDQIGNCQRLEDVATVWDTNLTDLSPAEARHDRI